MNKPNISHPALKELYTLIRTQDWTAFCPEKSREEMLDKWVKEWISNVEFSQAVVSTEYLTSEYNDIIKFKLTESLAEELAEECTLFATEDKKISAKMCAFRRKAKVWGQGQ